MRWREFLKVYIPTLIAVAVITSFLPGGGGWAELSRAPTGFKGAVGLVGFLLGFALLLILVSFGVGAVVWLVFYPFKAERPDYLRYVKNVLFVYAVLAIVGGFYGVVKEKEAPSPPEEKIVSEREQKSPEEGGERQGTVSRDEDGAPIGGSQQNNTAETWKETALWKLSIEEEVLKWISKGETVTVIERGGSHYKVGYKGDVGYVRKENLKPEDR